MQPCAMQHHSQFIPPAPCRITSRCTEAILLLSECMHRTAVCMILGKAHLLSVRQHLRQRRQLRSFPHSCVPVLALPIPPPATSTPCSSRRLRTVSLISSATTRRAATPSSSLILTSPARRRWQQRSPSVSSTYGDNDHHQKRTMVQGVTISDDGCIVNRNPATNEVISRIPCTPPQELDRMAAAAVAAQPAWTKTPPKDRVDLLRKGLRELAKESELLVKTIVKEMGKPLQEARAEVEGVVDKGEYLDILESALEPKKHGNSVVVRHPLGLAVVLSPWNFPGKSAP